MGPTITIQDGPESVLKRFRIFRGLSGQSNLEPLGENVIYQSGDGLIIP